MSNELIRELVDALDQNQPCAHQDAISDGIGAGWVKCVHCHELMRPSRRDYENAEAIRIQDLLDKARAYLASGGWTRVEDGLPRHDRRNEPPLRIWVSMNGETPWKYLYVQGDDPSGQFTHWRYAEPTPEPPKG